MHLWFDHLKYYQDKTVADKTQSNIRKKQPTKQTCVKNTQG